MGSLAGAPPGSPSPAQPSLWSHLILRPEDSSWGVGGGGTEDLVLRKEEKNSGSAHTPPGVPRQERAGGGGAGRCRDAPPLPCEPRDLLLVRTTALDTQTRSVG